MEPQIPQPPQKNNGLDDLKKEYLRTMQKDMAQMEEKKAATERADILQKGFVSPQQGIENTWETPQQKRPIPPPLPPRPPQGAPPIQKTEDTLGPRQQGPGIGLPPIQPQAPTPPRPTPPPPSVKPMFPPKPPQTHGVPPYAVPPKRRGLEPPSTTQTLKEEMSKFRLPPKKKGSPLIKILPIIILVLLAGGGASGYWFIIRKGTVKFPCLPIICKEPPSPSPQPPAPQPQPQPQPTPQPPLPQPAPGAPKKEKPTPPVSIIRVDKQAVYEIGTIQEVKGVVGEILKQKEPLHAIESVDFFIANERFLSFSEITQTLGLSVPIGLLQALEPSYTFFRFSQKEDGRLGFVSKVKDAAALRQQVASWEKTMAQDSEQFFALLGKQANKGPFKQASWKGVSFRYYDFVPEKLGIVYAIHPTQNLFIFASSGESMVEMINRIELK